MYADYATHCGDGVGEARKNEAAVLTKVLRKASCSLRGNRANYSFALCTSAHACDMECILRNLDVTKKLLQPFSLSPIAETFHAHLSRSTQRQQQHVVHQPTVCSHCTSEIAFLLAPPTRTTHKDGCLNCCGTAAVTPLNYNISLQVCDAVKKISCKPKSSRRTTGRKIDSSYTQVKKKKCPGFIFIISLQSVSLFGREDLKIFTN